MRKDSERQCCKGDVQFAVCKAGQKSDVSMPPMSKVSLFSMNEEAQRPRQVMLLLPSDGQRVSHLESDRLTHNRYR